MYSYIFEELRYNRAMMFANTLLVIGIVALFDKLWGLGAAEILLAIVVMAHFDVKPVKGAPAPISSADADHIAKPLPKEWEDAMRAEVPQLPVILRKK